LSSLVVTFTHRYIHPMTQPEKGGSQEARRKRLLFRAQRRGFKEVDLVFGSFAAAHLEAMNEAELDAFELLLDAPDQEVYAWLSRGAPVTARYDTPLLHKIKAFCTRKNPTWNV